MVFSQIILMIKRDLKLCFTSYSRIIIPVIFFIISLSIFPFAISNDQQILRMIAPGVMLCSMLLSCSLVSHDLFIEDHRDGTFIQLYLSLVPGYGIMIAKITIHFLCVICPILCSAFIMGLLYGVSSYEMLKILAIFLMIGPLFSAISCLCAVITLNCYRGNFISALISLPLNISVIIFTSESILSLMNHHHDSFLSSIYILIGLGFCFLPISFFFGGMVLSSIANQS